MRRTILAAVTWSAVLAAGAVAAPAAYADTTGTTGTDTSPTGSSPTDPTCAPLPAWVQGRPADLHARALTGDYLWHDKDGWHLRVTHPGKSKRVFSGVVVADQPITFAKVRDEHRDTVKLSADRKKLVFRFVNYGGIDGVDFADACATTTHFGFTIDGHRAPRNQIFIGAHSARPAHDPFLIRRHSSPAAA